MIESKEGYKKSEIGLIPNEWEVVKLSEICKFKQGVQIPLEEQLTIKLSNNTRFIRISDYTQKTDDIRYVSKNYSDYMISKDDVVMVRYGESAGFIGTNLSGILANNLFTINPNEKINKKYLYTYMNNEKIYKYLKNLRTTGAIPAVNFKSLNIIKIPLPPLKEQKKIADILSTTDSKIDSITLQIEKAERLKKGLLQKLLSEGIGHNRFKNSELGKIPQSWKVVKLKDCSKLIKDGTHGTHKNIENGIPLLSAKDIQDGKILLNIDSRKISIDDFNKIHKNYSLIDNDLLLTVVGTLGRVALVKNYNNNYTFQRSVAIIRLIDMNYPKYFYHVFNSLFFQKQLILHSNASAQAGIYLGELEKLKIPLPALQEQKEIADILSTADEKIEILRAKKEKYEIVKKGLLQKLLSGEIRTL